MVGEGYGTGIKAYATETRQVSRKHSSREGEQEQGERKQRRVHRLAKLAHRDKVRDDAAGSVSMGGLAGQRWWVWRLTREWCEVDGVVWVWEAAMGNGHTRKQTANDGGQGEMRDKDSPIA